MYGCNAVTGTKALLTALSICAGGQHGAIKRAYPVLSAGWQWTNKISRVRVGWSQIPHSRLLLGTRKVRERAGRPVGILTKLSWGNLNTPNSNHHDFDKYVPRARDWLKTKFKVKTYAVAYFCCQRGKWLLLSCFGSSCPPAPK